MKNPLYLQQLLLGPMQNFVYLIGSHTTREALVVDPAWDLDAIVNQADADDMKLIGALVTHYHPDHVGGDLFGHSIAGLRELLERRAVPIHVHRVEADGVRQVTGVGAHDLVLHDGGDHIAIGDLDLTLLHTPGHTPGSQCFLVNGNLVSGDTLFIRGCGRVDLPGSDPEQMYHSLTSVLNKLPDDTVLYPGHDYADKPTSTLGAEKRENPTCACPACASGWR
ncbi:MAG: MBL fold metallo-hydrolase [Planctomycetota bacterium]